MSVAADKSERVSYAVSVTFHAALLAALIYANASHEQSGVKVPAPLAIEILLPPMNATASSAPKAAEKPVEKVEDVKPDKIPVMREAVEAKAAPVTVAKTEEKEPPKEVQHTPTPLKEEAAPAASAPPSDAPVRDVTSAESQGAAAEVGGGTPGARADFNALVVAWIEKHKRYPENARRRGLEGTPLVRFRIDRSGHVLSAELQQGTMQQLIDKAALETISRADPFPQIPSEVVGDSIEFTVPIEFSMRR
jgi:protein TonB